MASGDFVAVVGHVAEVVAVAQHQGEFVDRDLLGGVSGGGSGAQAPVVEFVGQIGQGVVAGGVQLEGQPDEVSAVGVEGDGADLAVGTACGDDREGSPLRGRTTLADRAVARIAGHAVTELGDVGGSARRILGVAVGNDDPGSSAQVSARIEGGTASLHVRLSVVYPVSVAHTTDRVRTHLMRRTQELTGLEVSRVDITVTTLHHPQTQDRAVQ